MDGWSHTLTDRFSLLKGCLEKNTPLHEDEEPDIELMFPYRPDGGSVFVSVHVGLFEGEDIT